MQIELDYKNHLLPDMKLVCDDDSETTNCMERKIYHRDFMKEDQTFKVIDNKTSPEETE